MILPAPVRRKRACGAWSGCGRRLALSSGGEIRVYNDPWRQRTPSSAAVVAKNGGDGEASVAPGSYTAKKRNAWVGPESSAVVGGDGNDVVPVATGVRESKLPGKTSTAETDRPGAERVGTSFHTVLCVEAAMYEGGMLSSPGSSPGATPCPSSPTRLLTSRQLDADGAKNSGEDGKLPLPCTTAVPSDGAPERRNGSELDSGRKPSSSRTTPSSRASATGASLSNLVLGDMRAMCAAGPLAFFGATDGGLGLDSVFVPSGTAEANGGFIAGNDRGGTERGVDGLLGAIVDTSNSMRTDESSAAGGGSAVVSPPRRHGFRHVLPGENWLAGSLRPSSRLLRPDSTPRQQGSRGSQTSLTQQPNESSPAVSSAGSSMTEGGKSHGRVSPRVSRLGSASPPPPASPAEAEVLDLRGKLGGGVLGGVEGAATRMSAVSTHPLFHLSLPGGGGGAGGIGPVETSTVGSSVSLRSNGSNTCSSSNKTSHTAVSTGSAPGRGPWLVRASCRSNGVSVKALAALPPGLASSDLLASSEDGQLVAVGSHACDLVACYRLERQSPSGAGDDELDFPGGEPMGNDGQRSPTDRGGARRPRRRQRRFVPLCTLRLPVGYRAKGLTFVADRQLGGDDSASEMLRRRSVAGASIDRGGDATAGEVVVLVLAGRVVSDANSAPGDAWHPSRHGAALGAGSRRSGPRRSSAEATYRTVALMFSLPSGCSTSDSMASGPARAVSLRKDGAEGPRGSKLPGRSCVRDGTETAGEDETLSSDKNTLVSTEPSAALVGSRRGVSTLHKEDGREQGGIDRCGGCSDESFARLEAAVLRAVAGVERRIDERLIQMERVLGGVCDRLEALEGAVNNHNSRSDQLSSTS